MSKVTAVQHYQQTAANLARATLNLHDRVAHWSPEIGAVIADAKRVTKAAAEILGVLDPNWNPPHKKPTRSYERIVAGDLVQVREVHRKRTPAVLCTGPLKVVSTEPTLITVEHEGYRYPLERRVLEPAPKPAAPVAP